MDDYGSFRARLLVRIFVGKPTPKQVGEYLALKKARWPQIKQAEIDRYLFWGEQWPAGSPTVREAYSAQWPPEANVDNSDATC